MPNTYKLISSVTVGAGGASSIDFTSIPQTYTDLKIVLSARAATGGQFYADVSGYLNSSTTGYSARIAYTNNGTSVTSSGGSSLTKLTWAAEAAGSTSTANTFGNSEIYIPNYTAAINKSISSQAVNETNGTPSIIFWGGNLWANTAAVTSISLFIDNPAGNFAQYTTAYLYGIALAKASGGVVTTDGTYWYHTFLSSGTFTPLTALSVDYLVVAGGGGAGSGYNGYGAGGGGGGGLRCTVGATGGGGSLESQLAVTANTSYTVTVGAGGTAGTAIYSSTPFEGSNGSNSVFGSITSTGGGKSGWYGNQGNTGGSGGGSGGAAINSGIAGTTNQGYAGGGVTVGTGYPGGAGGGGAGSAGTSGTSSSTGTAGGNGVTTSISGTSTTYAAGGRGGNSSTTSGSSTAGGANTGTAGGGGVGGNPGGGGAGAGYTGGSGIVIVRYAA